MTVSVRHPSRRAAIAAGLSLAASPAVAQKTRIVAVLGDSITAGYGLPREAALPVQLESALRGRGANAVVRAFGVAGNTTRDGLARVDQVSADSDVCVVALGGNDLLQGADPAAVKANLSAIIARLKARGITVVLAGMRAPDIFGASPYGRAFDAAFTDLARQPGVFFYPSLLDGVMLNSRLNQPDGIHPNAAGVRVIAERLAPVVARALGSAR